MAIQDSVGGLSSFLLCGGVATKATFTTINIAAGAGYSPFSVTLGNTNAIPPATTTETAMLRVGWTAQVGYSLSGATLDGVTVNYLCASYSEVDGLNRSRLKGSGSWYFTETPSVAFRCTSAAPSSSGVLLATIVGNGTSTMVITPNGQAGAVAQVIALPDAAWSPTMVLNGAPVWATMTPTANRAITLAGVTGAVVGQTINFVNNAAETFNVTVLASGYTYTVSPLRMMSLTWDGSRWNVQDYCPMPVGAVYIQGPNDTAPGTLWPNTTWSNVSSEEPGAFRRFEGGSASAYGSGLQAQQIITHTHTISFPSANRGAVAGGTLTALTLGNIATIGSIDSYLGAPTLGGPSTANGTETRPTNFTARKWRRTA